MDQSGKTEKVRVWPEMVLRETIAILVAMILLLLTAMFIQAPLEEIADPSFSMNPSKAPWYFLGLQEMLVYFSPWVAGVAIPLVVVLALMAIPYLDLGRKTATGVVFLYSKGIRIAFSAGLFLWVFLTVIGLFFRGPNWALQWPDGTPLGGEPAVLSLDWLIPLVVGIYLLRLYLGRKKEVLPESEDGAWWQRCLLHLLAIGGLVVFLKILLYLILELVI
jgi:hypothetical protein